MKENKKFVVTKIVWDKMNQAKWIAMALISQ